MTDLFLSICQIILERLGARGVSELAKCFCFYLSYTLTGDLELSSNLLECSRSAVLESESELDNLLLTRGERLKNVAKLLAKKRVGCCIGGGGSIAPTPVIPTITPLKRENS